MAHRAGSSRKLSPRLWWLVILLIGGSYVLGVIGFYQYEHPKGDMSKGAITNAFYHPLQLYILHTPHLEAPLPLALEVARFAAPAAFGLAGILAFWSALHRECRRVRFGLVRNHVVICGLGEKGLEVVKCHRRNGDSVIVVEKDANNPLIGPAEDAGAFVVEGDMTDAAVLHAARTPWARAVVAIGGDESANIEAGLRVLDLIEQHGRKLKKTLPCFVHLTRMNLLDSFKKAGQAWRCDNTCEVRFFDCYNMAAEKLVNDWPPLTDVFRADAPRTPCVIVLGFGRMGRAVTHEVVRISAAPEAGGVPLDMQIIDRQATLKREQMRVRYPDLENRCNLSFQEMEADSLAAFELLKTECRKPDTFVTIVLCLDRDSLNVELALRLLPVLQETQSVAAVRLASRHGLAQLLEKDVVGRAPAKYLHVFGKHKDSCCEDAYMSQLRLAGS